MAPQERVYVVGVGMSKFTAPQKGPDYFENAANAARAALRDADLSYNDCQAAVCGYCYNEPTAGQRCVYELGLTGVPIFNVNNNCSTGSSALMLAQRLARGGYDCVLALGFERMERNLSQKYTDAGYTSPVAKHFDRLIACGADDEPLKGGQNKMTSNVIKMFGDAATEHMERFGTKPRHFEQVAYKSHIHSEHNENARNRKQYSLEDIRKMPLYGPLTLLQACPTADGAAAAIVCSESFVRENNLFATAVEIAAQSMVTDLPSTFHEEKPSFITLCGYELAKEAVKRVYNEAGVSSSDVDVLEVHDCFTSNEVMMIEALGLCSQGEASRLIDEGKWISNHQGGKLFAYSGKWVVNPSGGLLSKGHPIGATGLAQCHELCNQLRGKCGVRQVDGAKIALQHNFGLGSACVVTLYRRSVADAKL